MGAALQHVYRTTSLSRADFFLQTKFTALGGHDLLDPASVPYDPAAALPLQVV